MVASEQNIRQTLAAAAMVGADDDIQLAVGIDVASDGNRTAAIVAGGLAVDFVAGGGVQIRDVEAFLERRVVTEDDVSGAGNRAVRTRATVTDDKVGDTVAGDVPAGQRIAKIGTALAYGETV